VASITFHGLAESPDFPLHFNDWLLADTNGFEIPAGFSDGTLRVIPAGSVNGHVYLQGRGDHSGAEACVWDGSTNMGCVLTASDGSYEIGPLPAATYAVTAVMDRYLDSEHLGVVVGASAVTLPAVTLKGGDANDDCVVNILDLSLMGARFGLSVGDPGWDDRADINADGTINIQDIVLGGSNFGTTCPVPWP
jgi:hypothetical protein